MKKTDIIKVLEKTDSTVLSFPDRGNEWGSNKFRGNCSGYVQAYMIWKYHINYLSELFAGSGTGSDVAKDMGIDYFGMDLNPNPVRMNIIPYNAITDDVPDEVRSSDMCFMHPPYSELIKIPYAGSQWKDENGEPLDYVGISPANDSPQAEKNIYLNEVTSLIAASSNPNVKTHLYGMTSLDALSKYKCYSADSISHRLISGYAKILSPTFGVISVSDKDRTTKSKSNMSFLQLADEANIKTLEAELAECNFTIEDIKDNSNARVVFTMHSIQKLMKTKYKYSEDRIKKVKKLF